MRFLNRLAYAILFCTFGWLGFMAFGALALGLKWVLSTGLPDMFWTMFCACALAIVLFGGMGTSRHH